MPEIYLRESSELIHAKPLRLSGVLAKLAQTCSGFVFITIPDTSLKNDFFIKGGIPPQDKITE
ncbi:MAG: hypothetical protein ACE5OZ_21000 [Candidatus Heimdallarchaeota archaeon]